MFEILDNLQGVEFMKKLILLFLISIEVLLGFNIKYKYHVKPNISADELIKVLKGLPNGTVVIFPKKQKYYFANNKSVIINKEIVLELNYSLLYNLNITFKKPFVINFAILQNTHLNIEGVKIFAIGNLYLDYDNVLNIKDSIGWIANINLSNKLNNVSQTFLSSFIFWKNKINIDNSFVDISHSNIFSPLMIKNSHIKINNVYVMVRPAQVP